MDASKFEFTRLLDLLCRSENDPQVRHFCGRAISRIEHDEYYGALEFKSDGVDVVFKEAQWMKPLEQIASAEELYVAAFHLHRAGHEDFCGYTGQLPNGLAFGDREEEVLQKMKALSKEEKSDLIAFSQTCGFIFAKSLVGFESAYKLVDED